MSSKAFMVGLIFLGAVVVGQIAELPTAKVTVKVLDEMGNPMPNEVVTFSFVDLLHSKSSGVNEVMVKSTTDASGMASASGYSISSMNCDVKKDGYYEGGPSPIEFNNIVLGKWQPWNAVYTVVLKRIVNPIPMYAKKVQIKMPAMNQPIGFDLVAGDWVKPFGTGTTSDFIFTMSQTLNSSMDFNSTAEMTFANNGDGIQGAPKSMSANQGWSRLKFPRNAPRDGYLGNLTIAVSRDSNGRKEEGSNGMGYFFRVRTIKTVEGEIKSADYGKIDGDISIVWAATTHPGITFTYYFNPTGTTNLEFDPTKNLLNVAPLESVENP